ncbi:hypothetical protein D6764_03740, partial [Candidatus Woesearchaeota archaeon]
ITGKMENGEMKQMNVRSRESEQNLLKTLKQDSRYQKFQQQLAQQGLNEGQPSFSYQGNTTQVRVPFTPGNSTNSTAEIIGRFEGGALKDVKLRMKEEEKSKSFSLKLAAALIALLIALTGAIVLLKRKQHSKDEENVLAGVKKHRVKIDYAREALKMLARAQQLFNKGKFREAYGLSAYALRFYLAGKHLAGEEGPEEMTNEEVLSKLKNSGALPDSTLKEVKKCFDLCNLVEFAKYTPNENDFESIIKYAKRIIR